MGLTMPIGLQVFDEASRLRMDTTTRTGIVLGFTEALGTAGSQVVEGFALGDPFYLLMPSVQVSAPPIGRPTVTISGNTIAWTVATGNWRLMWGVR